MDAIAELRKQIRVLEYQAEYGLYALQRRSCLAQVDQLRAKLLMLESGDDQRGQVSGDAV